MVRGILLCGHIRGVGCSQSRAKLLQGCRDTVEEQLFTILPNDSPKMSSSNDERTKAVRELIREFKEVTWEGGALSFAGALAG